jgi:Ca2+-binding EF-hand superfamily protein
MLLIRKADGATVAASLVEGPSAITNSEDLAPAHEEDATHQYGRELVKNQAEKLPAENTPFVRRPSRDNALAERWQRQVEASLETAAAKVVSEKERRGNLVSQPAPNRATNADLRVASSSDNKSAPLSLTSNTANTTSSLSTAAAAPPKGGVSKLGTFQREVSGAKSHTQPELVATGQDQGTKGSTRSVVAPSTPKAKGSKLASFLQAVPSPVASNRYIPAATDAPKSPMVVTTATWPDILPDQQTTLGQVGAASVQEEKRRTITGQAVDVTLASSTTAAPSTPKAAEASKLASFLQAVPSPVAKKAAARSAPVKDLPESTEKASTLVTWPDTLLGRQKTIEQIGSASLQEDELPPTAAPGKSKLSAFLQDIPGKSTPIPLCSQPASSVKAVSSEPEEPATKMVLPCSHNKTSRITFTPSKSKAAPRRMGRQLVIIRPGLKPDQCQAAKITKHRAADEKAPCDEKEHWGILFDSAMDSCSVPSNDPAASPALGKSEFISLVQEFARQDSGAQLPNESDLAKAFVLANADKSGAVNKNEFLMLMKLIKQGKVTGLAGGPFDFANWGKEEAFVLAVSEWTAPPVASAEELESWRQQFEAYTDEVGTDELGNGDFVTLTVEALKRHSIDGIPSQSDLEAAFVLADTNASGFLDKDEFVKLMILAKKGDIAGLGSLAMMIWNPLTWGKESSFKKSLKEL